MWIRGRATQGVRLINLGKRNDVIASVCAVDSDPDEPTDEVETDGEVLDSLPVTDDIETETEESETEE